MTGRLFGLTHRQLADRLHGEDKIILNPRQIGMLRRHGLVTEATDWYASSCGNFGLAPGNPRAPWGKGHRVQISLHKVVPETMRRAA